jgi:DNA-binding transcriptional MerR regulator
MKVIGHIEEHIKRSRAAKVLDTTPRTLARWEEKGILVPIKLNSRCVVYRIADINRLLHGASTEVQ